jgi:hypothetical protein
MHVQTYTSNPPLDAGSSVDSPPLGLPRAWPSWVCHKCRKPNAPQLGAEPAICTSMPCRHLWCMECPDLVDVMEQESRVVLGEWGLRGAETAEWLDRWY